MDEEHKSYITVTFGMRGYFAVMYWWNPEGFWEPYNSGFGSYKTRNGAEHEAREWADAEGLEFKE